MTSYELRLFNMMSGATTWTEASLAGVVIDTDPSSPTYGKPCLTVGGPIGVVLSPVWAAQSSPAATSWSRQTAPPPAFTEATLDTPTAWKEAKD